MLDIHGGYVIPGAQGAIIVDPELGYQEEGNARGAFFGARGLGEHEVNDVFRQVVISGSDEAFRAGKLVLAGSIGGEGLALHRADFGTRAWFGEPHGAAPVTGDHLGQKQFLLLLGAEFLEHRDGPLSQTPVHNDRGRCTGLHFQNRRVPGQRYFALAAETKLLCYRRILDGFINFLERLGGDNRMFIPAYMLRTGLVGIFVGRTHQVSADFIVDIEEIVDVVNTIEIFVSVKAQ